MGANEARAHLARHGRAAHILEFAVSTATVGLAAQALGTDEGRIAKSLSFSLADRAILVVTAGDQRVDNQKFRNEFGAKAVMLAVDEVERRIGHGVGGVCPFGVLPGVEVFLDVSLRAYDHVFPACGSQNTAIRLTCDELAEVSEAVRWVDVCRQRPV